MKRFKEIVKELTPADIITLHGTEITCQTIIMYIGIYDYIMKTRMCLSNTVLIKIDDTTETGNMEFYGIDTNIFDEVEIEEFEIEDSNRINMDISNIAEICSMYIPKVYLNHLGSVYIASLVFKTLLKALHKNDDNIPLPKLDLVDLYPIERQCKDYKDIYEKRESDNYTYLVQYLNASDKGMIEALYECYYVWRNEFVSNNEKSEYETDWKNLLGMQYDFYVSCEKMAGDMAILPSKLYELHKEMGRCKSDCLIRGTLEDYSKYTIHVEDGEGFSNVWVSTPEGLKKPLHKFSLNKIISMKIKIDSQKLVNYEDVITVLYIYILFPDKINV